MAGGGFWPLLQAVAWGRMIAVYARDHAPAEALRRTFDGKHPCPLCHAVAKGQREDRQKPPLLKVEVSFDFFLDAPGTQPPEVPTAFRWLPRPEDDAAAVRRVSPPKPPPRAA